MPEITHHGDPFGSSDLFITCDNRDPEAGGVSHEYVVMTGAGVPCARVYFQHGPRGDGPLTGANEAALLAILIDRLECFQAGPFAHESNARALTHVRNALDTLRSRSAERKARGVLGQYKQ